MGFKILLFCLLLLLPLVSADTLDINISNEPLDFAAGKENIFYYNFLCNAPTNYIKIGDIIDYRIFLCYNDFCSQEFEGSLVFKVPCDESGVFTVYIPETSNGEIVDSVEVVFVGKNFLDTKFPMRQVFSFGGAFHSDASLFVPLPELPLEFDFSPFLIGGGVLLVIVSVGLLYARRWYTLLVFFLGVALIVFGIFS